MALDAAYAAGVFDRLHAQGLSRRYVECVLELGIGAADRMSTQPALAPEELALLRILDAVPGLLELFEERMARLREVQRHAQR